MTKDKKNRRKQKTSNPNTGWLNELNAQGTNLRSQPFAFPDMYFCRMKYVSTFNMTSSVTEARTKFQTSLYDPQTAVGGHQPYGFDALATVYNKYIVYGMDYKITASNDTDVEAAYVTVVAKPENTLTTGIELALERPRSQLKLVQPRGSNSGAIFTGHVDVGRVHGVPLYMVNCDDKYNASVTADPSKMAYLFVRQDSSDFSTSVTCRYVCELTFFCCMYERKLMTQSFSNSSLTKNPNPNIENDGWGDTERPVVILKQHVSDGSVRSGTTGTGKYGPW